MTGNRAAATVAEAREGARLRLLVAFLAALGLLSRLAPLLDHDGRLLRQFPSEDGYLMLTIARNLALGLGMSTADGTIPTNGTQPLATFLYAGGFWAVEGDRAAGVAVALALQIVLASGTAWLLYRLGRGTLGGPAGAATAALAAAAWYAAPLGVRHTMNGLETGLYALCVVAAVLPLVGLERSDRPALLRFAGVGALLGVAFWARNDAVFLCLALGLAHLAGALPAARARLGQRVAELAVAAPVAAVVALPWPVANLLRFGHPVPISGRAESMAAAWGENMASVPVKLFEHLTLFLPVPADLEARGGVVAAACLALVVALGAVARCARRWNPRERTLLVLTGGFGLGLAAFYGLAFGAGHFMSRYLFPVSPFLALLWAGAIRSAWRWLDERDVRIVGAAFALLPALLALGLNVRLYVKGDEHLHFQVVEWVERNVPERAWVGAIQTGTVGFFHDRTINLDGKVNPEALEARSRGEIPQYVIESRIDYLVDWVGIAGWIDKGRLEDHFELVLEDAERNLAVLRRRQPRVARALAGDG